MRIEPTHFIKSWDSALFSYAVNTSPIKISKLNASLRLSIFLGNDVVALFLIRLKTPQEQEKSIYYPKTNQ